MVAAMRRIGVIGLGLVLACGGDSGGADPSEGSSSTAADEGTTATPGSSGRADSSTGGGATGEPVVDRSPGCGADPSAIPETLEIEGTERTFTLALPDGYDPDEPYTLVFAWHALGTNGDIARVYYQVEEASEGQAIVVYPNGLPVASQGGLTGWNLEPDGYDLAFYDELYQELTDNLCVDLDRVFSTGHSFGAFMSNAVGCFRGEQMRAIAPVAGGGPYGTCQGSTAVWLAHGTSDPTVPFETGQASHEYWADRNTCDAATMPTDPSPCVRHEGCAEGLPVVWCQHDETEPQGGHHWPSWAGAAIWAFFDAF